MLWTRRFSATLEENAMQAGRPDDPTLPRGIVPILQTPYSASGAVDETALRRLVEYAIESGAGGLITPAVASEVERLTDEERRHIVETVTDVSRGRVPVVVGASSPSLEDCVRHARHGAECGCTMTLVQAPQKSDEEIERFYNELCGSVELDLMVQDLDWTGSGMSLDLIERLFESLPRFRFIKVETVNACPKYTRILERMGGQLHVSGGWAVMQLIESLDRGVHAFMPEASMVGVYEAIRRMHAAGRRDRAWQIFEKVLPVLSFSNQHIETSIHFFKRLLMRRGIFSTCAVRPPTCTYDAFQEKAAEERIQRVLDLEATL